jgi:hypothetical protein
MPTLLEIATGDTIADALDCQDVFPASVTVTRTSQSDVQTRQLIVWIDEARVATLLWGDSVTSELEPGRHRIRVSNTLVWKTIDFELKPGEQVFFEAINRTGPGTYVMLLILGAGPLYLTLRRMV